MRHITTLRLLIRDILSFASIRPPGYVEDVLSHGRIDGDWIEIEDATYRDLVRKYQGGDGICLGCGQ